MTAGHTSRFGADRVADEDGHPSSGAGARWVLAVTAALAIALGGVWLFSLQSASHLQAAKPGAAWGPARPGHSAIASITLDDVRTVLDQVDYTEPSNYSVAEYQNTVKRLLAGVDSAEFARTTLDATPTIWWFEPRTTGPVIVTGARKQALILESVSAHSKRGILVGAAPALADILGVHMYPPTVSDRNRPDSQLEVMEQGLAPLGLMFGAHDPAAQWSWHAERVTVTGRNTADVTYSATTSPGTKWRFANPKMRYTKHLVFSRCATDTWRLSGWTNYAEVNAQLRGNISPSGTALPLDEWWGRL